MAAKKAQGAILGNRTNLAEAQKLGAAATITSADAFAANALPIVREMQAKGLTTTRALAAALNDRGVRTARGGAWHNSTLRNLLARATGGGTLAGPAERRAMIDRRPNPRHCAARPA